VLTKAEVTIERPRDEVFRRFAHELATTYPLICPFTTSVRMDPEKPMAAGATGQMMVRNLFMPAIVDFTVTRYEKGERLSIEARHGSRSSRSDYLFRDAGTATIVTMVTEGPAVGPRWLKALLEGRGGDPTPALVRRNRRRSVAVFVVIGATLALAWFLIRTLP